MRLVKSFRLCRCLHFRNIFTASATKHGKLEALKLADDFSCKNSVFSRIQQHRPAARGSWRDKCCPTLRGIVK